MEPFLHVILHVVDEWHRCGEIIIVIKNCVGHGTKTTKTKKTYVDSTLINYIYFVVHASTDTK